MTDPQAIADGLSEAQRRAILDATIVRETRGITVLPLYRDGGKLAKSLVAIGLASYSHRGCSLTKNGKAVRAILANASVS